MIRYTEPCCNAHTAQILHLSEMAPADPDEDAVCNSSSPPNKMFLLALAHLNQILLLGADPSRSLNSKTHVKRQTFLESAEAQGRDWSLLSISIRCTSASILNPAYPSKILWFANLSVHTVEHRKSIEEQVGKP